MVQLEDFKKRRIKKLWLDPSEIETLINCGDVIKDSRARVALELMGRCGLRVSEVAALSETSLIKNPDNLTLKVLDAKTGSRTLPFPPHLVYADLNFSGDPKTTQKEQRKQKVGKRTIQNWVNLAADEMVVRSESEVYKDITPHALRRSAGTNLYQHYGVDIEHICLWLGMSEQTFRRYYLIVDTPHSAAINRAKVPFFKNVNEAWNGSNGQK